MYLFGVTETGGDQHAAIREPVHEAGPPRLLIAVEPRREGGVQRRNTLENQVSPLRARGQGHLLGLQGARGDTQGQAHRGGQ